jgi:hypothetical protein
VIAPLPPDAGAQSPCFALSLSLSLSLSLFLFLTLSLSAYLRGKKRSVILISALLYVAINDIALPLQIINFKATTYLLELSKELRFAYFDARWAQQ